MTYNSDIHHRRSIRLKDYNYSQSGAYFVTICAWQRECLFGEITGGVLQLNDAGLIVDQCWQAISKHCPNVELDELIIMPNHMHGILHITEQSQIVGAKQALPASPVFDLCGDKGEADETFASPLRMLQMPNGSVSGSFSAIIQNFKSVSTRRINRLRQNTGCHVWQGNYYERVIRNDEELNRAREYILHNPLKWSLDKENPTLF